MQAILLAAGYGTRLRPYSTVRPKPLFPVVNRPLLHLLLEQLHACACSPILVNCHHLAAQIEAALAPWPEVLVQYEPEILGTGGSLRKALKRLHNEPVLVMNGDLFHRIDVEKMYRQHQRSTDGVTLAMHDYPRFNTVGVQGDRIRTFGPTECQQLAFAGIHVLDPEVIEMIPEHRFHHIIDLYQELAVKGRVGYVRVDGSLWRDIGTPEDYLQLHGELLEQEPTRWVIDPTARIGHDVQLKGWGCIGAGARIGDGVRLCRSVLWEGADIPAGSSRSDAIITGNREIDAGCGRPSEHRP
jgi:mannose-1-phosphate guanylyltransferase